MDYVFFATDANLNHELSYRSVDNEYVPVIRSSNQRKEQDDFNKRLNKKENMRKTRNKDRASASVLLQFTEELNLQQVLTVPTYKAPSGKLLFTDVVYTNLPLTEDLTVVETGNSFVITISLNSCWNW